MRITPGKCVQIDPKIGISVLKQHMSLRKFANTKKKKSRLFHVAHFLLDAVKPLMAWKNGFILYTCFITLYFQLWLWQHRSRFDAILLFGNSLLIVKVTDIVGSRLKSVFFFFVHQLSTKLELSGHLLTTVCPKFPLVL